MVFVEDVCEGVYRHFSKFHPFNAPITQLCRWATAGTHLICKIKSKKHSAYLKLQLKVQILGIKCHWKLNLQTFYVEKVEILILPRVGRAGWEIEEDWALI